MTMRHHLLLAMVVLVGALGGMTGCESTGSGGAESGAVYYGTGFSDPWYYGDCSHKDNIIVTPPDRPVESPPRPAHPIATPPSSAPRPTPMPSIPSAPRPAARGGRGR